MTASWCTLVPAFHAARYSLLIFPYLMLRLLALWDRQLSIVVYSAVAESWATTLVLDTTAAPIVCNE